MSNYSQITDFSAKDSLATGNANKIIYGADIDAELAAISTAIATKLDDNNTDTSTIIGPTTASGSSGMTITGISADAKEITISLNGISTSGAVTFGIQLGTASGIETSSYFNAGGDISNTNLAAVAVDTTQFSINTVTGATYAMYGNIILTLHDSSANTWTISGVVGTNNLSGVISFVAGRKSLAATLDRIKINGATGSFPWDNGSISLLVKY